MLIEDLFPTITIGLDLGDRVSRTCEVNAQGKVVKRASVLTTPEGIEKYFGGREPCRVVLEVGTHSPWVSRLIEQFGHETIVGNPARIYVNGRRKNDDRDAEFLARQGRSDPALLFPIQHRSAKAQEDLALLRSRDQLVATRTKLICHVRGLVKSTGHRLRRCDADCFGMRMMFEVPAELRVALKPVLEVIEELQKKIKAMDRQIERAARHYPVVKRLQGPAGVGPVTSLGFVLLVEDPKRFRKSRDVGPYFGLVPKLDESSGSSPQLHISKTGDKLGRRLLVGAANYVLGPRGPECDLRRFGQEIMARGGKNAKKRAVVAVARKLAVLLHKLWITETDYDPNHLLNSQTA